MAPPLQPAQPRTNTSFFSGFPRRPSDLVKRICSVLRTFTESVEGVKNLNRGILGFCDAYDVAATKGLWGLKSEPGRFKWLKLQQFCMGCDSVFPPLGIAKARHLLVNRNGECRSVENLGKVTSFKDQLSGVQEISKIALAILKGVLWIRQPHGKAPSGLDKRLLSWQSNLSLFLLGSSIATTTIDLFQVLKGPRTASNCVGIAQRVTDIALGAFDLICEHTEEVAASIPKMVKKGVGAFSNFYQFGTVFINAWRYP